MSIEKTSSSHESFEQYRESYLTKVAEKLYQDPDHSEKEPRNRSITYVPYRGFSEKLKQDCPNIVFADRAGQEVVEVVTEADVIINIARGEEVVEAEINHPDRNVKLPPESLANTEMVGDLYLQAIESGNTNVQVVHTGRMNNRTIAMATAMPILAESAGLNYENVIHTPDAKIRQLVEKKQVNLNKLMCEIDADPKKQDVQVCTQALRRIYEAREINPDTASSSELTDALLDEYNKYPRISTSTLMKEQMLENVADQLLKAGKSAYKVREIIDELDAHTDEEPDSVDTVTNFTNSILYQ